MNRIVVLLSLLIAVLSAYGQQQVQWYDISKFAPSVKQCKVSFTEDRLYVYVNTGDKDVKFWVGEPQRTEALVVLNGNDMMEYRQGVFNEFIIESLSSLPANATVQSHNQQETKDYDIDPLENPGIVFYPVEKEPSEEEYADEDTANLSGNRLVEGRTDNMVEKNTDNIASGVVQQSNDGLSRQQSNRETSRSKENFSALDDILENILAVVIVYWLLESLFKGFSSSSSSKKSRREKSSSEKDYEDGPAWFHDHGQNL